MPPKAKFTKDQVFLAAFEIVRRRGQEALTARALALELGSSPRPIFTVCSGMEEIQAAVERLARNKYEEYEDRAMGESEVAFKGSGVGYIRFAVEEPELFRMLFMRRAEKIPNEQSVLIALDGYYDRIVSSIVSGYGFDADVARALYLHMWIYSHGIATAIATGVCSFTEERISSMLTAVCSGLIGKIRRGERL